MSENVETTEEKTEVTSTSASGGAQKLGGIFAYKEGMSTIYNEAGEAIPVTVLRFEPSYISQIKTKENDGYEAVQIACLKEKKKLSNKAEQGHLSRASLDRPAKFIREIRQSVSDALSLGAEVSIDSVSKGDKVCLTARSKGRGFTSSIKRWNHAGGPASHGSKFHRRPGSSGNRTWPGRVMPGKKFPGHWGDETVTVKHVEIIDVIAAEKVVLVKGPVPGGRNTLVQLVRE